MSSDIKRFNSRSVKNFVLDHIIEVLLIILVVVMSLASKTFLPGRTGPISSGTCL